MRLELCSAYDYCCMDLRVRDFGEEFRAETEWIWIEATGAITESRKAINLYYYYPLLPLSHTRHVAEFKMRPSIVSWRFSILSKPPSRTTWLPLLVHGPPRHDANRGFPLLGGYATHFLGGSHLFNSNSTQLIFVVRSLKKEEDLE